jgi:hypothetical protein
LTFEIDSFRLNLLHINILHDIPIQGKKGLSNLQNMRWIFLVHPDDTPWNDPKVAQTIESLMGFGSDEDDSTLLA